MAASKQKEQDVTLDNPRAEAVDLLIGRTISALTFNDDTGTVTVHMDNGRFEVQGYGLKLVCIPTELSKLH